MPAMDYKLVSANIVVLANSFNPSIASKEWLLEHVVTEEPKDFVITPMVAVYKTDLVDILVDQSRLQVNCLKITADNLNLCSGIVASYIEQLPHTPYTAVGFNYAWETAKQTDGEQRNLRNRLVSGLGNLDEVFASYSVAPSVLGVIDGAQVRVTVDPSLELDKPMIVRVNYHYSHNDWQSIAQTARSFVVGAEESRQLIESVLYHPKEDDNVAES